MGKIAFDRTASFFWCSTHFRALVFCADVRLLVSEFKVFSAPSVFFLIIENNFRVKSCYLVSAPSVKVSWYPNYSVEVAIKFELQASVFVIFFLFHYSKSFGIFVFPVDIVHDPLVFFCSGDFSAYISFPFSNLSKKAVEAVNGTQLCSKAFNFLCSFVFVCVQNI